MGTDKKDKGATYQALTSDTVHSVVTPAANRGVEVEVEGDGGCGVRPRERAMAP
jgi:hypothetical protein